MRGQVNPRISSMERVPAVYIVASQKRGTIYTGVTSAPIGRLIQHRDELIEGFTKRYGAKRLVLIEFFGDMESAILREKQLKRWHRQWKINLIEANNPGWRDLALEYALPPLNEPRHRRRSSL
jgi:putative endonuclease